MGSTLEALRKDGWLHRRPNLDENVQIELGGYHGIFNVGSVTQSHI